MGRAGGTGPGGTGLRLGIETGWEWGWGGVVSGWSGPGVAFGASRPRGSRGVRGRAGRIRSEHRGNAGCALPAAVDIQPACLGLYCGRTVLSVNGSVETYGDCGVSAVRAGLGLGRGDVPTPSRAGPGIGSAGRTAPEADADPAVSSTAAQPRGALGSGGDGSCKGLTYRKQEPLNEAFPEGGAEGSVLNRS